MLIFLVSAVLTPRVLSSANPNNVTCSASALGPCYVDGKSNLGKVKTTDPGDCCAACIANAECYHWQIHSKSCHLRARENGMNKGDDCIRDAAPSPPRPSPGPSPAPTPPAPPAPPSPPVAPPLGFKPNILFMLADDFGHYNVGWRNKEARTPNMDGLVANGLVLDRHYGEGA